MLKVDLKCLLNLGLILNLKFMENFSRSLRWRLLYTSQCLQEVILLLTLATKGTPEIPGYRELPQEGFDYRRKFRLVQFAVAVLAAKKKTTKLNQSWLR